MFKKRIIINPEICHGKPVIRGTRIMVWQVLDLLKDSFTFDDIVTNYFPQLTKEDIKACIEYANQLVKNEEVHFVKESK